MAGIVIAAGQDFALLKQRRVYLGPMRRVGLKSSRGQLVRYFAEHQYRAGQDIVSTPAVSSPGSVVDRVRSVFGQDPAESDGLAEKRRQTKRS